MLHCDRSLISISPLCRAEQPSLGAQLREAEPHGPAAQPHGPAEPPGAAEPRRPAQPRGPASTSTAPPATGTREQVFHFLNGLFFFPCILVWSQEDIFMVGFISGVSPANLSCVIYAYTLANLSVMEIKW